MISDLIHYSKFERPLDLLKAIIKKKKVNHFAKLGILLNLSFHVSNYSVIFKLSYSRTDSTTHNSK